MERELRFSPWLAAGLCLFCFWDGTGLFWPFLAGILLHEAGHLLALALLRVPVGRISLGLTGAVLDTGACTPGQEAVIAAAGPLVTGLLALIGYYVNQRVFAVNLVLLGYNLLPLYPLDGGRLLGLGLEALLGRDRGKRVSRWIGYVTVGVVVLWGLWATFVAHRGPFPALLAAAFLLRLPKKT